MRVAVVQLNSTPDRERNLATADRLTRAAAAAGAELVVLPEKWPVLGSPEDLAEGAEPLDGPALTWARSIADELSIDLVAGSLAERVAGRDRGANTSVHIGPDGRDRALYRKIHMFDVVVGNQAYRESDRDQPGDEIVASETATGIGLGLSICYDLRFPEIYRHLAVAGVRIVAVPSAFTLATTREHWELLLRGRAVENQVFVVAANQIGEHAPGYESGGRSMIIDPWGVVLAQASDTETIAVADLDLRRQEEIRARFPSLANRRPAAYAAPTRYAHRNRADVDVEICEVGPRDGLQNESRVLAPEIRAELVDRLVGAGCRRIEVGSFVNADRVPTMARPERVLAAMTATSDVTRAALVLNEKGYERAAAAGVDEVHLAFGVSDSFNRRNQGSSVDDSLQATRRMVERARRDGRRVSVILAVAFGCPFEGDVDPGRVVDLAAQLAAAGPDELVLADTIGVAVPSQVRRLVDAVAALGVTIGLHLHNTRNNGYSNAYAGLEAGVRSFDASVGGSGGCPFAPGATGNVATQDLAWMLEREGLRTGLDLDRLAEVARWLEGRLGYELPGQLHRVPAAESLTQP